MGCTLSILENMKKYLCYVLFLLVFTTACMEGRKGSEAIAPTTDTVVEDTLVDTYTAVEEETKADGFFDDFIYIFMTNHKVQRERTSFPLPVVTEGKVSLLQRDEWKYNPLYSRMPLYILLYKDEASVGIEKDTTIKEVLLEMIDFKKNRIQGYTFKKEQSKWRLVQINHHQLKDSPNRDFYTFYYKFSTHSAYQKHHIKSPFDFKTYDADNFSIIEGTLEPEQFLDYAPQFPQGIVAFINYENPFQSKNSRALVVTGIASGMSSTLFFQKQKGKWLLTKLTN